jgi:hypothetical protein
MLFTNIRIINLTAMINNTWPMSSFNCNVLFSVVGIFVRWCVWNIYFFTLFIEQFQVTVRLNFLDSFKRLICLSLCFIIKQIKRLNDDKYSFFPWRQICIHYTRTISWFASNALIFKYVHVQENFKIFIELIIRKSSFHAHWLFSIICCWFYDILPFCFPILRMTLAMNIKTKYRIPVLLNNNKNYCREQ